MSQLLPKTATKMQASRREARHRAKIAGHMVETRIVTGARNVAGMSLLPCAFRSVRGLKGPRKSRNCYHVVAISSGGLMRRVMQFTTLSSRVPHRAQRDTGCQMRDSRLRQCPEMARWAQQALRAQRQSVTKLLTGERRG